jgi:single-strand DNA-binding protein
MNHVTISGRLGRDPELVSPNGSEYSLLKFSIANNDESKKDPSTGQYEPVTSWFDVEFWTKNPQHWLCKLYKGYEVVIECTAKQNTWEQDGQNRSKVVFKLARGTFPLVIANDKQEAPAQQQQQQEHDNIPF